MTDAADLADPRRALLTRRAAIVEELLALDASFEDIVEASRDSNADDEHDVEGVSIATSRAQVSFFAGSARRQLGDIDAALIRVDEGRYGVCERCAGPIEAGRLEALPATPLCIECARAAATAR